MIKGIWLAAALALGAAGAADAAGEPFKAELNTDGSPVSPADKLVSTSAVGALQAWRGRPWWHVYAFCIGAWNNAAYEADDAGDKARSDALHAEAESRFIRPALERLMSDRKIDADAAAEVIGPDVNFQFFVAGDEERPFAEDQTRCRIYEAEYGALKRAGG